MLPGTTGLTNGRNYCAPRSKFQTLHRSALTFEHHAAASFIVECTRSKILNPKVLLEGCPQTALHKPIHRRAGSPMGLGVADLKASVPPHEAVYCPQIPKCRDSEILQPQEHLRATRESCSIPEGPSIACSAEAATAKDAPLNF